MASEASNLLWKGRNPDTLLNTCIKYCVKNLYTFCSYDPVRNEYSLKDGVVLLANICEKMIESCRFLDMTLDDKFLKLFSDPNRTRLRHVNLKDSYVSDDGIEVITHHRIAELDISNCTKLTRRTLDLLNSLQFDLISLVVGNSVAIFPETLTSGPCNGGSEFHEQGYILCAPMLRKLNIHGLHVKEKDYFTLLLRPFQQLTYLDLSECSCRDGDFQFLAHLQNLIYLILYRVHGLPDAIPFICKLKNLRHLDLSQVHERYGNYKNPNQVLEQIVESLPELTALDISGTNLAGPAVLERKRPEINKTSSSSETVMTTDIPGLQSRANRPLEFLGLLNTFSAASYRYHIPAITIAGEANETQILNAAEAYIERPDLLLKVLNELYSLVRSFTCNCIPRAFNSILNAMRTHLRDKQIQVSGSASLYYLVRGEYRDQFNLHLKREIIRILLDAMYLHRNDMTMLRNGCLTLLNFNLPEDVLFDCERLVDILLYIVSKEDLEDFVQRMGIYVLNTLACQVDGTQKQLFGSKGIISIMLQLIEGRITSQICDDVMETAWSTMWNVTDETPINCKRFLDSRGMSIFLRCLKVFPEKSELLRNMMGLLGNVAEVKQLRPRLMKDEYIIEFNRLLDNNMDGIEVSYNAAGILSHIASDGAEMWEKHQISCLQRSEVLGRMIDAIERWNLHEKRNINYRSFEPILRLLQFYDESEAQYWAVWALANLTSVYPTKYCPLLIKENGVEILNLLARHAVNEKIKKLIQVILQQCELNEASEVMPQE